MDWGVVSLSDMCDKIFAGGDVPKGNFSKYKTSEYSVPIFANGEKNKGLYGYTNIEKVTKPSITVSARGTIGYSEIRHEPFFPIVRLIVLVPDLDVVNLEFLKYIVLSMDFINKGSSIPQLTVPMIKDYKSVLPPIPEQKRIVAILDQVFADIEQARAKTEQNLKNARELFGSCLNGRLIAICSRTPTQTLSCITELVVDCEHKTAPTQEKGFPSIRTPNIGKGELILDNVKRVSKETYDLWTKRSIPQPRDLILAREAPAGNVGVIPDGQQVCLGQRTVLIRPIKDIVDSRYLAFLLLHPIMQNRLLAHSTGATVQHVNMKDIRQLGISELPEINKQLNDVAILLKTKALVLQLEKVYLAKLNALNELKKSILQKAFTGELTKTESKAAAA